MKVGDELNVIIEASTERGDGIARVDDIVVFIPGVKKDEKHHISITKLYQKVAFAEVKTSESKN